VIALSQASAGETHEVTWIMGDLRQKNIINSIGITEGSSITVVNSFLGSVILTVNNMRYALSNDLAFQIKME
jgi:Fe2+ transport system protein FeoA